MPEQQLLHDILIFRVVAVHLPIPKLDPHIDITHTTPHTRCLPGTVKIGIHP